MIVIAAIAMVIAATPAHARPRYHHNNYHHHHRPHERGPGQPAVCAGIPWCGCWLRLHLGLADIRLNLARAWAAIGHAVDGPAAGVIVVWPHHVGIITENLGGGLIRVLSGNDGNAVRERVRSTRGVIAYRKV